MLGATLVVPDPLANKDVVGKSGFLADAWSARLGRQFSVVGIEPRTDRHSTTGSATLVGILSRLATELESARRVLDVVATEGGVVLGGEEVRYCSTRVFISDDGPLPGGR